MSSVFAGVTLTLIKLIVGLVTNSIGILSEAAHSALDLVAALLTYFAVSVGDKPADEKHPYGHGKVESVSALIETGLLFLTSFWIIYEAVERLFFKSVEVEARWYSVAVMVVSIIVDFSRSRALNKVAKETNSQALEADALHFSSDIWSSTVVLLGLGFVVLGMNKADALAAICVAIFVIYVGFNLGKRTIAVLIDTAPEGLIERISEAARKVDGVVNVEKTRVRPAGAFVYIDMVVNVARKLSLDKTQSICQAIDKQIHEIISEADIMIHAKPLPLDNETIIERVQIIATNHNLAVHDIVVHTQDEKKYLNFDLEVAANLSVKEAHQVATQLEKIIADEIGTDTEINIHIEPVKSEVIMGKNITVQEENRIKKIIINVAKQLELVEDVHDIHIIKTRNELFISLHCAFDDNAPLEEVHKTASRFEYLVKNKLPNVQRLVVHSEPFTETKK